MDKWEYKKIRNLSMFPPVPLIDRLNELGQEGWELVQCHIPDDNFPEYYEYLLKRKILCA